MQQEEFEKDAVEMRETQAGNQIGHSLTAGSEQFPNYAPDITLRAMLVTIAAGLYWIGLLYNLISLATYSRTIAAALNGSSRAAWILNAFNVVTIIGAPCLAYWSDLYGRKYIIVGALPVGVIGAIIGCRATSMTMVFVATALLGVAGSLLGVVTAVPSEVMPHRYRSAAQASVSVVSIFGGVAALCGPAHVIRDDPVNGWRTIFYSLIGIWAVLCLIWLVVYNPPPRRTTLTQDRPSLDYIGYALLTAATVPFLMGLTWGGNTYPWTSAHVLASLIVGIVMYIVFGLYSWKARSDGLMHHDLFKNRNFALCIIAIGVEGFVYQSFSFLYPANVATVIQPDIFLGNLRVLPFYGCFLVSLIVASFYVTKTRDTVTPIFVGYIFLTGALLGLALSTPSTPNLHIAMNALAGLGFALPLCFLTVVAQFAAPAALIGTSTAVVLTCRSLGGAIGIAVTSAVQSSKLAGYLPAYIAAATLPLGLNPQLLGPVIGAAAGHDPAVIAQVSQIPGITPQILGAAYGAATEAFSKSFNMVFWVIFALSVVGGLSILLLKRNREQLDFIVDAPIEPIHHTKAKKEAQV